MSVEACALHHFVRHRLACSIIVHPGGMITAIRGRQRRERSFYTPPPAFVRSQAPSSAAGGADGGMPKLPNASSSSGEF